MTDLVNLTGTDFVDEWVRSQREWHRRRIYQLKREFAEVRRESDLPYRPVVRQVRG